MLDPRHASLSEAARALAAGEVSSEELTRDCLERAHRLNATLNCFVRIDEAGALEAATLADRVRARGKRLGPLHGVPVALKDMFYRPGRETGSGSRLRQGHRGAAEASVLRRLRAAGAVSLGELNMTEFALGPTGHNELHGPCRNPWNPAHIAGGSSSGSGAALAARIAFGTLGSDTAGSIRGPACANGVLGLKPTYGRVSRAGAMRLSWSMDHVGPLARTAEDLARLLAVIAGPDPQDPTASAHAVPDYPARLGAGVRGLRIGVPENFFFEELDPAVGTLIEAALAELERQGARRVAVTVPDAGQLTELGRTLMYSEATALHGHFLRTRPEEYSAQVRARAATGIAIPAAAYLEALQLRAPVLRRFVEAVFSRCELLATPTLALAVPTLAATDVRGGPQMWHTIARLVRCVAPFSYLGVPALNVPVGFTADGLPAGLQLVGRPFAEPRLLAAAAAYQAATDWHTRLPPVS